MNKLREEFCKETNTPTGLDNIYDYVFWLEAKIKALSQHDVSNRRELLIAFSDAINVCDGDKSKIEGLVDLYLKSN